jgi:molybdenum-dependent DNA-binding transcriptional regulator ModE
VTDSVRKSQSTRRFNAKTTRAVSALLRCGSISKAAQAVDVSERTLSAGDKNPNFWTY